MHTSCHPTLQHHNSYNRTDNYRQWNAVGSPDDGHKDAWNMLRYYWLPINHYLLHLVGLSFTYLSKMHRYLNIKSGYYVQIRRYITCMLQAHECRRIKAYSKNNCTHSCIVLCVCGMFMQIQYWIFCYWGICIVFYSHEKKFQETKQKLSEAEKVGENLSELKVALQELQKEGEKIKQKEDEIKKKEKVCVCSVIYVCVPKLIAMQIQANMETSCTIAEKCLAGSSLLYCLHVMIMVGTVVHNFSYRTSGYISEDTASVAAYGAEFARRQHY